MGIAGNLFNAVSPDTSAGLSILAGDLPYYHLEDEGTESAMTSLVFPDGSTRSLVWWGGPKLPEVSGGVIARYADTQEPAMIETTAGAGLVILSGPHPEAPEDWRTKLGLSDSDGLDQDLARKMIQAAVSRQRLVAF